MINEPRKEFNSSDSAAPRPAREDGPRRPYGPRKHFAPRRKVCRLCAEKIAHVDYKQVQIVKSFCADGDNRRLRQASASAGQSGEDQQESRHNAVFRLRRTF